MSEERKEIYKKIQELQEMAKMLELEDVQQDLDQYINILRAVRGTGWVNAKVKFERSDERVFLRVQIPVPKPPASDPVIEDLEFMAEIMNEKELDELYDRVARMALHYIANVFTAFRDIIRYLSRRLKRTTKP